MANETKNPKTSKASEGGNSSPDLALPESIADNTKNVIADTNGSENSSFLDILYNKIISVIGGDNPNQYFCMSLPGTIVNPKDYSYNTDDEKPAHVKANESKLVNKLFDACFMTAVDNGKHFQNQYRTALNMLSPKLNRDLFEMKVRLREVLMTPYKYDFGTGTEDTMTLEQVFYRLYSEYVNAKAAWNQKQMDKKAELKRTIIDPNERKDAYLEWYGLIAESERVILEEKLGKVLNVFSPSDMNIINGILNCGVGGELEEARTSMDMVQEISPDGGYIYPVKLYPSDWFKLLESSFTGVDLLESAPALSQKMKLLEMQRSNLMINIAKLMSLIPNSSEVAELKQECVEKEQAYTAAVKSCVDENINATSEVVKGIVSLCMKEDNKKDVTPPSNVQIERVLNQNKKEGKKITADEVKAFVDTIQKHATACYNAQVDAVNAASAASAAALTWCEKNNKLQLKNMLEPLKVQLESVNTEIATLQDKIALSKAVLDNKVDNGTADVMPNKETDGFTQLLVQASMSSIKNQSSKSSESSNSKWGVSFLLGGYSSNKSHQESVESSLDESSKMEIQIGMNIAKVQIERSWFNPGVFQLTNNMYNFSSNKISASNDISFADSNAEEVQKRFDEMNDCIFPAYPVAFVIAKDVSIRFASESNISASFAQSIEDHASQGGGFLNFSGNSSKDSSSGSSAAVANSNANGVTVRFAAPQILGYYMQVTPTDKSVHINSTTDNDMSVIGFVSKFKEMIEDYNRSLRENAKEV